MFRPPPARLRIALGRFALGPDSQHAAPVAQAHSLRLRRTLSSRRSTPRPSRTARPSFAAQPLPRRQTRSSSASAAEQREDAPPFFYRLAAAYSGKKRAFDAAAHRIGFDSLSGQHWVRGRASNAADSRSLHKQSGQDACFLAEVGDTFAAAFAVADGVGGWAEQGIDSAAFAHGICNHMGELAANFPKGFGPAGAPLHPLELLQTGFAKVCADPAVVGGGSTVCVAVAAPDGTLAVANLGDSGFMHLRQNAVHFTSDPQTHAFNTPYQLSQTPPKILAQIAAFGGRSFIDMPRDAGVTAHALRHGDVLVLATDGVWDNLAAQDVLRVVSEGMAAGGAWADAGEGTQVGPQLLRLTERASGGGGEKQGAEGRPLQDVLAANLVKTAKLASRDARRDGPFAKAVQKKFPNENYRGGKEDDICVVVAIAIESEKAWA